MDWYQITLHCGRSVADHIAEQLEALGAQAVTLMDACDQPVFQVGTDDHPLWDHVTVTGLFAATATLEAAAVQLKQSYPDVTLSSTVIPDQPWERVCLDQFEPLCFGNKLWVCPTWRAAPTDATHILRLDPGLAFGTGTHETTQLCLEWLATTDMNNKTIVDYGCGSGILALAARILGASAVWAVDTDPQALIATRANAALNGFAPEDICVCPPQNLASIQADIIIANILCQTLVELAPVFAQLGRPQSKILLCGILATQQPEIELAYKNNYNFQRTISKSGWLLCEADKIS